MIRGAYFESQARMRAVWQRIPEVIMPDEARTCQVLFAAVLPSIKAR
jgi:hypothetical protein